MEKIKGPGLMDVLFGNTDEVLEQQAYAYGWNALVDGENRSTQTSTLRQLGIADKPNLVTKFNQGYEDAQKAKAAEK